MPVSGVHGGAPRRLRFPDGHLAPYNVGKDYDVDLTLESTVSLLHRVHRRDLPVLEHGRPGGGGTWPIWAPSLLSPSTTGGRPLRGHRFLLRERSSGRRRRARPLLRLGVLVLGPQPRCCRRPRGTWWWPARGRSAASARRGTHSRPDFWTPRFGVEHRPRLRSAHRPPGAVPVELPRWIIELLHLSAATGARPFHGIGVSTAVAAVVRSARHLWATRPAGLLEIARAYRRRGEKRAGRAAGTAPAEEGAAALG